MRIMKCDLKTLRMNIGFSQVKLAHESGVSLPTIQNIEANKANPTVDIFEKIFHALGLKFEITPIPFNVEVAIAFGVPLTSLNRPLDPVIVNAQELKHETRKWHHAFLDGSLGERERLALTAFLIALKTHYPNFYNSEIANPVFEKEIQKHINSAKVIKLRRLALNSLSKYL